MSALPEMQWTEESYLAFERASDVRHEYLNGNVVALAGASKKHNLILVNTLASLHAQLRNRSCELYSSDMKVKVTRTGLYTYPDISIVCDTPQLTDDKEDTLLNPTVIIEVLSPSTESYDRGKKFQHYRTLDSLQEYVLIAQDSIRIEHYSKQSDGQWLLLDLNQPESVLELSSIDCKVTVTDIYEKVSFEAE